MSEPLSIEFKAQGDFASMVETAQCNALIEGGAVVVHRRFNIEHLGGLDCPCRPILVDADSPRKPNDLLREIETLDG